jgi:HEAT repeat protein
MRCDAVLKHLVGWNAAHRLDFLENQLQLIQIERGEIETVRFWDNQVAVRLAAEERRATLDLGGNRWNSFLRELRLVAQGATANVEPFALALYDCCVASSAVRPEFVLGELGQLAGLEAQRVQRDLVEQQTCAAVSGLGSADQQTRLEALGGLCRLALRSERALATLIDVLCDVDTDASAVACDLVVDLGSPVVGPLCERLDRGEAEARLVVAGLLRRMGMAAQSALPSVMRLLADGNDTVRAAAVSAIAAIAPDELPVLEGLLRDGAAVVRAACAEAFGTLGASAEVVAGTMTALLDDETEQVRLAAVTALGQIRFASVDEVTGLIKALIDKHETVRHAAEVALGRLRGLPVNSAAPEVVRDAYGRRGAKERTRHRSVVTTRF